MARILIVDDDPDLADVLAAVVEDTGNEPVVARSATEARSLARVRTPALVLADWNIPGGGAELIAEQLREDGCGAPIVVMTGMEVLRVPWPSVLGKPFTTAQLLAVIEEHATAE